MKKVSLAILIALCFTIAGCTGKSPSEHENGTYGYSLEVSDTIPYIQITDFNDKILQEKINSILYSVPAALAELDKNLLASYEADVTLQSTNYISVLYSSGIDAEGPDCGEIRFGITIDLETGERVFLDDLIEINTKFHDAVLSFSPPDYKEAYTPISEEKLEKITSQSSISELEYLQSVQTSDPYALTFAASYIRTQASFYLTPEALILMRDPYYYKDIRLEYAFIDWIGNSLESSESTSADLPQTRAPLPAVSASTLTQNEIYEVNCAEDHVATVNKETIPGDGRDSYSILLTQGKDGSVYRITAEVDSSAYLTIALFNEADYTPVQIIDGYQSSSIDLIDFIDINLDGYADLQVNLGGTINEMHKLFLWAPESGCFVEVIWDGDISYYEVSEGYIKNWLSGGASAMTVQTLRWADSKTLILEAEVSFEREET